MWWYYIIYGERENKEYPANFIKPIIRFLIRGLVDVIPKGFNLSKTSDSRGGHA